MAAVKTWYDVLKFDGVGADEIVDAVKVSAPEFTGKDIYGGSFDVGKGQTTVEGDVYKGIIRVESTAPDIFKNANEGISVSSGEYVTTDYRLGMAGSYFRVDRDLVRINPKRGAEMMKAEGQTVLSNVIKKLGVQFFYGLGTDATAASASEKGFQGIEAICDAAHTISAGGTVSGTSTLTSAYLVKFSEYDGVTWLFGRDGTLTVSDIIQVPGYTGSGDNTKAITWLQQEVSFYPGLAVNSPNAVARIANITTSSTATAGSVSATTFTDEYLMRALETMKESPDAIFMTRKAGLLLGASRVNTITVKSASLRVAPISMPTDFNGIPILYTDSLLDSEAAYSV